MAASIKFKLQLKKPEREVKIGPIAKNRKNIAK